MEHTSNHFKIKSIEHVELVEYNEDPIKLLKNILNEKYITDIKISERLDGSFQANVEVDGAKKGVVVGREGRNAEKGKNYFLEDTSTLHM